ncbi:MAG TPA: EAL domain-containing protein [Capillimicrobium sp.]
MGAGGQQETIEAHLRAVVDVLDEGIVSLTPDLRVGTVNDTALRIVGLSREDLDTPGWWARLRARRPDGGRLPEPLPVGEDIPVRMVRASDGAPRELLVRKVELAEGGAVIVFRDQTEERRARARLAAIEVRDPLTGLPNRAAALTALDEAATGDEPFALLLVDLDGFKAVNVGLGQAAGDAVLREAAARLRAVAPRRAQVARFGGDDFLVIVPGDGPHAALAAADRLQDAFAASFAEGGGAALTASMGIACSDAARDAAGLISAAEAALTLSRSRGRGLVAVFDDALQRATEDRVALVADLRQAIESHGLRIAYQPIVRLAGGERIIGVEALARWTHPDRGEIPPSTFIALAEDAGLVRALGRRVLARACMEIAQLRADLGAAGRVRLSVNVSARQVASGLLDHDVVAALTASGLPAHALALELTESALMDDSGPNLDSLATLRERGVRLLIDDFGTGYSSLTRLRRLPVDGLKVDRSFVAGLGTAAVDTAIVEAILTMAQALGLPVVAEGVESDEQAARLRTLGCPAAQGYLLGRPMTLQQLRDRLAGRMDGLRAVRADV